jgi:hypothetical protein
MKDFSSIVQHMNFQLHFSKKRESYCTNPVGVCVIKLLSSGDPFFAKYQKLLKALTYQQLLLKIKLTTALDET